MPVSIVVGGQYGSEGKGKVSLELTRRSKLPVTAVRVGGPNSGHTGYDLTGKKWALRQLPASCVDRNIDVYFPAGSYIDCDVLEAEIDALNYPREKITISPWARVILPEHREWEAQAGLQKAIGSTGSGVGAAVMATIARGASNFPLKSVLASDYHPLQEFVNDVSERVRREMRSRRFIIEGTQGFGLSLLEGGHWPKATSRSTTAAGALAEAGFSPLDVDDVTMVIRSFPIRVAGDSGPLINETSWGEIGARTGKLDLEEYTTVTKKLRRVGEFDPQLVRHAIDHNSPTRVVMNHLDYIGAEQDLGLNGSEVGDFVRYVEKSINRRLDWLGFSPSTVQARETHDSTSR